MHRLKDALQNRFDSRGENVEIHTPRNLEPLLLEFKKRQNLTKVIFVSNRYYMRISSIFFFYDFVLGRWKIGFGRATRRYNSLRFISLKGVFLYIIRPF